MSIATAITSTAAPAPKPAPAHSHAHVTGKPLGPDSLMWRWFGDSRFLLFFGQGLTVQVAHPVIGQGVADHSSFKTDPYGRFQRSLALLWPVVYNTPEGALAYGRRLREMHRNIKGKFADGSSYYAFNIEAYLWVHMAVFDAAVRLAELSGEPLGCTQQKQLFEEWRQMGLLLGIREQDMPADIPAFWKTFENIIEKSLWRNETLDFLLDENYYLHLQKPPIPGLPQKVWEAANIPLGHVAWLVTRATLPASFRQKFHVSFTKKDERNFRRLIKVINAVWRVLPERAHYLPEAYAAVRAARRHPERYRATI